MPCTFNNFVFQTDEIIRLFKSTASIYTFSPTLLQFFDRVVARGIVFVKLDLTCGKNQHLPHWQHVYQFLYRARRFVVLMTLASLNLSVKLAPTLVSPTLRDIICVEQPKISH